MICPICNGPSRVVDSRAPAVADSLRRRRECIDDACAYRWTTQEVDSDHYEALLPPTEDKPNR